MRPSALPCQEGVEIELEWEGLLEGNMAVTGGFA